MCSLHTFKSVSTQCFSLWLSSRFGGFIGGFYLRCVSSFHFLIMLLNLLQNVMILLLHIVFFLFLHTFFSSWKLSLVFTIAATTFDTLFYLIQACVLFFIGLLFSHHYKIVPSSETNSKKYIFVSATLLLPTHKKGFHTPIFHD